MDHAIDGSPSSRRATDSDVAREAGVSRATVYYVLNDDPKRRIPEATRAKVMAAVDKLGYVPFGPARLLRGGRSSVVLLLTHGLEHATDYVANGIVTQMGAALEEKGLHLVWQLDSSDERDPLIDLAPSVVLSSARPGDEAFEKAASEYSSVPVAEAFPGLDAFLAGAALAQVAELHARGRRHVVYVAPAVDALASTVDIRWRAIIEAAEERGMAPPLRLPLPLDRARAGAEVRRFAAEHPEVDGVCAFNDETAFVLLAACADQGIDIPGRWAVIGVDDHPYARSAVPPLTTVVTPVEPFVEDFVRHLVHLARGEETVPATLPSSAVTITRTS